MSRMIREDVLNSETDRSKTEAVRGRVGGISSGELSTRRSYHRSTRYLMNGLAAMLSSG